MSVKKKFLNKLKTKLDINPRLLLAVADILKEIGVGIFSEMAVGLILEPKPRLFIPSVAIGCSAFLWYINLNNQLTKMIFSEPVSSTTILIMMMVPPMALGLMALLSIKLNEKDQKI